MFLVASAILGIASAIVSRRGFKIDFAQAYLPVTMRLPELGAVLLVSLGIVILRPRLWIIDRLGLPRRRWVPSAFALAAGFVGPQLILAAATLVAMPAGDYPRVAANVVFLTALAFCVAPYLGAFVASGLVLMLYFSLTIASQMEPAIASWSPLAVSTDPGGRWTVATTAGLVAVVVTVSTLGRVRRTWGADLELA
ncbi:hypothetical protein AB0M46_31410 [Dactylosporangium sp. NPDC051485]|uniref:hypothetical protein n=1 Tax=Dactylosporangium sp. NPDC051485 TaxID=3154846 RepID=UPI003424D207